IPPDIKGYIILEVKGLHIIYNLIKDIKHVKGRATGSISIEELEKLIITKPVITELKPGDLVEIISGPFKGLKATVVSVNLQRNEVTLNMLESSYKLEATVPGDYVRPVKK
ncbi:MAG: transcription elongation factor Spt5, partial [Desulfurococcaceae archaeon]|nr:transcription elongation factor Spt5 [Desulfurococcaceae archaeon]